MDSSHSTSKKYAEIHRTIGINMYQTCIYMQLV